MIAGKSGTIMGNKTGSYSVEIDWSEMYDNTNNTSLVTANVYITYYSINIGTRTVTCSINGINQTKSVGAINHKPEHNYRRLVASFSQDNIAHNSDGSSSIDISASFPFNLTSTNYGYIGVKTAAQTVILTTISLAAPSSIAKITNSSGTAISTINTGNDIRVYWSPVITSLKYRVCITIGGYTYYCPSASGYITVSSTNEIYTTFSILHSHLPSSETGTAHIVLVTYNSDGDSIGIDSEDISLTVPASIRPNISSFTGSIVNGLNGHYVQNKSKCALSMNFTSSEGSTISSYYISGPGISSRGSSNVSTFSGTTDFIPSSGRCTFTAVATDARGRSDTKYYTINNVYSYASPIVKLVASRAAASGSANITYTVTYSDINGQNSLGNLVIYKKLSTGSTWATAATIDLSSITGTTHTASTNPSLTGFDPLSSYSFYATVTDTAYGSVGTSQEVHISSEFRLINITNNVDGIALGKMADTANLFDCELNAKFGGDVTINGMINNNNVHRLYGYTVIPPNSDFNNYTTPGTYFVKFHSDMETIANTPSSDYAGVLIVYQIAGAYDGRPDSCIAQEFTAVFGNKYFRLAAVESSGTVANVWRFWPWTTYLNDNITDDYIVEQGTSSIWTYRKWNSGVAECWGTEVTNMITWSAWGNAYESSICVNAIDYPLTFVEAPIETASIMCSSYGVMTERYTLNTTTKTSIYHAVRPTTSSAPTSTDARTNIYVSGKWK